MENVHSKFYLHRALCISFRRPNEFIQRKPIGVAILPIGHNEKIHPYGFGAQGSKG